MNLDSNPKPELYLEICKNRESLRNNTNNGKFTSGRIINDNDVMYVGILTNRVTNVGTGIYFHIDELKSKDAIYKYALTNNINKSLLPELSPIKSENNKRKSIRRFLFPSNDAESLKQCIRRSLLSLKINIMKNNDWTPCKYCNHINKKPTTHCNKCEREIDRQISGMSDLQINELYLKANLNPLVFTGIWLKRLICLIISSVLVIFMTKYIITPNFEINSVIITLFTGVIMGGLSMIVAEYWEDVS